MQFGQLHHVEYYVNDLEKTKEFWGWFLSKMGYEVSQSWPQGISYAHSTNKTYLVFVQVAPQYQEFINNRQAAGLNHIAFQGGSFDDLKMMADELRTKNIKILTQHEDMICFEDPNQFAVEIFC